MDLDKVFKLLENGFTKDEIMRLASPSTAPKDIEDKGKGADGKEVERVIVEEVKSEPVKEEKTAASLMTDEQIDRLAKQINIGGKEIDIPPAKDITSVLADRLKAITTGK